MMSGQHSHTSIIRTMSTQSLSEIEYSEEPYRFPTVLFLIDFHEQGVEYKLTHDKEYRRLFFVRIIEVVRTRVYTKNLSLTGSLQSCTNEFMIRVYSFRMCFQANIIEKNKVFTHETLCDKESNIRSNFIIECYNILVLILCNRIHNNSISFQQNC